MESVLGKVLGLLVSCCVVVGTTVGVLVTMVVVPVEDLALRSTQPQRLRIRKDTNPLMV